MEIHRKQVTVNHRHHTAAIAIREIESFVEMRAVEELQKEVWAFADLDVPRTILVAGRECRCGSGRCVRWLGSGRLRIWVPRL